uniref:inositol-polyphosphate 5-phosphatase n=1 Tax=Trypanosoma congolense (strain IL3000) TaxID=1068625 RepID=G0V0T4_TRYCI|nr:unnamed protein product [Trypanosoma congolense IL3000]
MRSLLEGITSTLRLAQQQEVQQQAGGNFRDTSTKCLPSAPQPLASVGVSRESRDGESAVASMDLLSGGLFNYSRFSMDSPPDFPFKMLMVTQNIGGINPIADEVEGSGGEGADCACDGLSSGVQRKVMEFLSELRLLIFEYSLCEYTAYFKARCASDESLLQSSVGAVVDHGPPPLIDVIVVHLQEIGGKKHHREFIDYLSNVLLKFLPEAGWTSGLLMETNGDKDLYTAVGSVVFVSHRMCPISSILSFHHRTYVCVTDDPVTYGSSPAILFHGKKFSGAGDSRKGFLLISLRLGTVVVNFLNVHLYNDTINKNASVSSPSPFEPRRQEALLEALAECVVFVSPDDPLFIFGDFNTRLDICNMLQYLKEVKHMDVALSSNDIRSPDSFWELFEDPQYISVIKPYDVEIQRLIDVVAEQSGIELAEFVIRFPPTYLCQLKANAELPQPMGSPMSFSEDNEIVEDLSGNVDNERISATLERITSVPRRPYMRHRIPAWCDRVLWNPAALELMTGRRTSCAAGADENNGNSSCVLRRYAYRSAAFNHTDHDGVTLLF